MIDLSLATAEDMLGELHRRGIYAVLVTSHAIGHDTPRPKIGAEQVYDNLAGSDAALPKRTKAATPAGRACVLCNGLQRCVNGLEDSEYGSICVELSQAVTEVHCVFNRIFGESTGMIDNAE